ncbi:MAG: glycosyl hydrolase [Bryobacteraceae bacterium]|nr:glycosyl hydrolase [Bryobacteraceae bacterium]
MRPVLVLVPILAALALVTAQPTATGQLERGWRNPPPDARPHTYWLWLNGHVNPATAREELQAMKDAGFGGVLLFDMGARGEKSAVPPAGPAFLSPPWMKQFKESVDQARQLGLQVDFSVVSSWDLGGHWIEPKHGSMGLYPVETTVDGGRPIDLLLPFPPKPPTAPAAADGKPAFWRDAAVLAVPSQLRGPGHDFVIQLDPAGDHALKEAILDNGNPGASPVTATMSPTREFSIAVSSKGTEDSDFKEVLRASLPASPGPQKFALPAGTRGRCVRLRLLSAHDSSRPRWTLGEFGLFNNQGVNVALGYQGDRMRNGAAVLRSTAPYGYGPEWNRDNLHDGDVNGPRGVFATAGSPPFHFANTTQAIDVTRFVDTEGRLKWNAPAGQWTILRYLVMNIGERLKVPSPNSDGWATDHFSAEATHAHMDYVIARLKETFGDLKSSGLANLYLASYEVVGPVWSPGFLADFKRLRGYDMTPYLPAVFGARVIDDETTARFLFDYRKTLSDVLIQHYYVAARDSARKAGLGIKSEAGGPGPPVHNVPVDSLLANAAVDDIQGEFWPFRPNADGLWVVKETASAGHIYGKPRVHMESFTSFEGWQEGPQDLKPSADRVFTEGGNHMVWHTWTHGPPEAGKPGWVYLAGTHINRNVTWWPKAKPFLDYLSRSSFLLQRGRFVGDVLYYYGDGGFRFIPPRRVKPNLGPGYDYDYTNSDVILNRLSIKDGRFTLPDGTSYAVLVLPDERDVHPAVLTKLEKLVADGGTLIGAKPERAAGLEGYPTSDATVRELAARLWAGLDGKSKTSRPHGKGRVIWGKTEREVLASMNIPPDVTAPATFDFIHRNDGAADIYFLRNTTAQPQSAPITFRSGNREPELWNPVTAAITSAAAWRRKGKAMEVPITLPPNGSVFVVFQRPAPASPPAVKRPGPTPSAIALNGPWSADFEGGPKSVAFPQLTSWTTHSNSALKHFSGTAIYRTTFRLPADWRRAGFTPHIDLGRLWNIGEVWLNGKSLGVAWTAPFTVDASNALQEGENQLVVEVTNTWFNRLVGDAKLPPAQRTTRTNVTVSGGKPWAQHEPIPSGLFGPVRLIAEPVR